MTSSYFQGSSDGSSNAEITPDIGYHFMHLWSSATDRIKALARQPVGSPSKETPAPAPSRLFFTTGYMSQDAVEPVAYLMALPLSSTTMSAAQSRFMHVLLKDDCTCIYASTIIIPEKLKLLWTEIVSLNRSM